MNIQQTALYYTSIVGFLFCACSNEEKFGDEEYGISIQVEENGGITSRTTSPYVSTHAKIRLYHEKVNSLKFADYVYEGSSQGWTSVSPLSWYGITKINGVYPLYAVAPEPLTDASSSEVFHDQSVDVSGYSNFEKSDQLMAYTETGAKIATLSLTLQHLLAQLRIVFLPGEKEVEDHLKDVRCLLKGVKTNYTITYPLVPTVEIPATTTAFGSIASDVKPYIASDATTKTISHNTILPPQTLDANYLSVSISIQVSPTDTRTAVWKNPAQVKLEAGKCTVITLNLYSQVELVLGDIKVTPWNETDLTGDFGY